MNSSPISLTAYARLLRGNRNYRLLWSAQVVSEIGDWLYTVAIYSLILELTGSARAVSFALVLQVLPQVFASPTAGVLNDRLSRRKVMIFTDWARAVITFGMLFVQTAERLPLLYCLLVLETICWAMFEPGRSSIIPNLVEGKAEKLVANALSSSTWSFNLAVGAALGGFLAAAFGRNTVFVLNSASFIVSALLLTRMQVREPHLDHVGAFRFRDLFDFSPIAEGIRYVRQDGRLLATMFVKGGLGLMGANWVLLPILGEHVFPVYIAGFAENSGGMLGMSVLLGSRGVGALVGPLIAGSWSRSSTHRMRVGILLSFLAAAAGYYALSWAPTLLIACLCIMLAHSGGATGWVFSSTLLQIQTDDRFRGRVSSAEFAFSMLTLSTVCYIAGSLNDSGVPVRTLAAWTGFILLVPALAWLAALRLWKAEL